MEYTDVYAKFKKRHSELFKPIPLTIGQTDRHPKGYATGTVFGWQDIGAPDFIDVKDNGELLVNLDQLDVPVFTTGDYFSKLKNSAYEKPLKGSTLAQYVRIGTGRKLTKAQALLPDNCRIVVFDAWRSMSTQHVMYEMCYQSLVDRLVEEGMLQPDKQLDPKVRNSITVEVQKFVSLPSPLPPEAGQPEADRERAQQIPSPHNTGGSIDLAFVVVEGEYLEYLRALEAIASSEQDPFSIRKAEANFLIAMIYRNHARLPDFGTAFDFAGAQSGLTYCETNDSLGAEARDSRRILYNIMTGAGFEPYEEEWWHFNDGNQMAKMTEYRRTGEKSVAQYGNTELTDTQQYHEHIHKLLFDLLVEAARNPVAAQNIPEDLKRHGATPELVLELSAHIGDPTETASFIPTHDMKYRGDIPDELVSAVSRAQGR